MPRKPKPTPTEFDDQLAAVRKRATLERFEAMDLQTQIGDIMTALQRGWIPEDQKQAMLDHVQTLRARLIEIRPSYAWFLDIPDNLM